MAFRFEVNLASCNLHLARPGLVAVVAAFALPAGAVTNVFLPVADTSLIEVAPANNLGGFAGMHSGTTQNYTRNRALMRFDLTSLPTNSVVLSARLELIVTYQPDEPPSETTFGLHRMLRAWGEGDKSPTTQAGKGLPANPGEATWECAFHPTNHWTLPGGAPDADFASSESSFQSILGFGDYTFATTPELVADVTAWVSTPGENFGWMLLCNNEDVHFTARRFGTREDITAPPLLTIEHVVPPRIDSARRVGNQFELQFTAEAGQTYVVEHRSSFTAGNWQPLTNLGPAEVASTIHVRDEVSQPHRFYRLNTY